MWYEQPFSNYTDSSVMCLSKSCLILFHHFGNEVGLHWLWYMILIHYSLGSFRGELVLNYSGRWSAHKSWDRLHCKLCMVLKTALEIICLGIRLNFIGCGVSFWFTKKNWLVRIICFGNQVGLRWSLWFRFTIKNRSIKVIRLDIRANVRVIWSISAEECTCGNH